MDPLSVAGSLAGLIQLGDIVFSRLYRYIKEVKNADKDAKHLKDEIAALNGVLHNLRLVAQDLENTQGIYNSTSLSIVLSCRESLTRLKKKLEESGIAGHDIAKFRGTMKKLAWPFKASGIKDIVSELRQHRDKLTFALSADSVAVLLKSLGAQEEIATNVVSIAEILENMKRGAIRTKEDDMRKKVLLYFLLVDPMRSFQTSIELRHPRTGRWLAEHDVFRRWQFGSAKILWLYGIAGAGKTVLSGLVIEECLRRSVYSQTHATAFFYCDHQHPQTQTLVSVLGSLISQLGRKSTSAYHHLEKLYEKSHPKESLAREPTSEELSEVLIAISKEFEDVRLVVDGLDECSVEARKITMELHALASSGTSIYLLLLSRDEPYIRECLPSGSCQNIEIEAQSDELDLYVRGEIETRRAAERLILRDTELVDKIAQRLVTKAQGSFRWVACQLDYLSDLPTDASRRKALANLPRSLAETYDRILLRIKKPALPLAQRALRWIAYATPQLDVNQLVEILSVEEDDEELDVSASPDPKDILRVCGSLVRLNGNTMELAHFTVLEYLEALTSDNDDLRKFRLSPESKVILGEYCARYLSFPNFDIAPLDLSSTFIRQKKYTFHKHACSSLPEYLRDYQSRSVVLKFTKQLFEPRKTYNFEQFMLGYWWQVQKQSIAVKKIAGLRKIQAPICSPSFKTLHAAALLHISGVCEWLLTHPNNVNSVSGLGSPLECAILGFGALDFREVNFDCLFHADLKSTVCALLRAGANPNDCSAPSRRLGSVAVRGPLDVDGPLAALLRKGMFLDRSDLVTLVEADPLRAPPLVNLLRQLDLPQSVVPRDVWNMLEKAAALQKPSDVASRMDDRYAHDLKYALQNDDVEKFKKVYQNPEIDWQYMLDEKGPWVNLTGDVGSWYRCENHENDEEHKSILLFYAVDAQAFQILEFLRGSGLDLSKPDTHSQTIMHKKTFLLNCKDTSLFRRMITTKAMQIQDTNGDTIWHLTAWYGRADLLEILLERHSTQLNRLHGRGCKTTPLLQAIQNRQAESATVLIPALNSRVVQDDPRYYHLAVAEGLTDVVKQLYRLGCDPSSIDDRGRNAFFYVTYRTGENVLQCLLNRGVDPDAFDGSGKTAFTYVLSHHERAATLRHLTGEGILGSLSDSIISVIATKKSLSSKCPPAATPWGFFCNEAFHRRNHCTGDIIKLFQILLSKGAYEAHEKATNTSGIVLLVHQFLLGDGSHLSILTDTLAEGQHTIDYTNDGVLIQLFAWLVGEESSPDRNDLIDKLLAKGVSVDTPSPSHENTTSNEARLQSLARVKSFGARSVQVSAITDCYHGCSAVDAAFRWDLDAKNLRKLIPKADISRLTRLDDDGTPWFHRLCSVIQFPASTDSSSKFLKSVPDYYYHNNYDKLEVIVRAGVDPNMRSTNQARRAAIHVAAASGLLGAIQRLHLLGADLSAIDGVGWGIIPLAVKSGNITLLEYLAEGLGMDFGRERFPITCDGPLGETRYMGCSLLHLAATMPITEEILQWLFESAFFQDTEVYSDDGLSPLHFAASLSSPHSLKWFIDHGSDISAEYGPRKRTPLHIATEKHQVANVIMLVQAGAEFVPDISGVTPEQLVHPSTRMELIRKLSACGMPLSSSVMYHLVQNRRPLKDEVQLPKPSASAEQVCKPQVPRGAFDAIAEGDLKYCRNAFHAGILPERIPECGICTPLIVSLLYRRYAIVDLLLNNRMVAGEHRCCTMHARAPGIESVLNIAVSDPAMISRLENILKTLANDGDHSIIRGILPLNEASPLHVAAAFNPEAICILMNHANMIQHNHLTALVLDKSTSKGTTISETVLNQPLNRLKTSQAEWMGGGGTALHIAAWNKQPNAIKALVAYGAGLHVSCGHGRKPLHYAVLARCASSVKLLLELGASPRSLDSNLRTPLMVTCSCGPLEIFEILFDRRYDLNMTDIQGQTALHLAAQQNRLQVFVHLIKLGWDPYKKDCRGRSALFYGLLQPQISTFLYASDLDLTTIASKGQLHELFKASLLRGSQRIFHRFPREAEEYFMGPTSITNIPLYHAAAAGRIPYLELFFRLVANFCNTRVGENEDDTRYDLRKLLANIRLDEILRITSSAGQLQTLSFLLRHQLLQDTSLVNYRSNLVAEAIRASLNSPLVRDWLLVGRHSDQHRITQVPSKDTEAHAYQHWSGVRKVQVPLTGQFARRKGWALLHVLHEPALRARYSRWVEMVPVDFDAVSNFVATPEELRTFGRKGEIKSPAETSTWLVRCAPELRIFR